MSMSTSIMESSPKHNNSGFVNNLPQSPHLAISKEKRRNCSCICIYDEWIIRIKTLSQFQVFGRKGGRVCSHFSTKWRSFSSKWWSVEPTGLVLWPNACNLSICTNTKYIALHKYRMQMHEQIPNTSQHTNANWICWTHTKHLQMVWNETQLSLTLDVEDPQI